jgi:rfaE bifunctional protein kinase chain/domain/rfaE bifunctional protein nucleotidyltransferase chain/domain
VSEARLTPDVLTTLAECAPRITVVGDVMLDEWWYGDTHHVSREAPAPVVSVRRRVAHPGGAANTAVALAALGARARIVGIVGDDDEGRMLRSLLDAAGVDTSALLVDPEVRTTTKTRVVSGDQILVRIDEEPGGQPGARRSAELLDAAAAACDALLVSDYESGMLDDAFRAALASRDRAPLVVVDAHDPPRWRALAPDVVTPNADEFSRTVGVQFGASRVEDAVRGRDALLEASGAASAVVTLDRDGTVALVPGAEPYRTFAHPASDRNASGAGDTFVAALTFALSGGTGLPVAAELAQLAADVVVGSEGTSVCTLAELLGRLAPPADPSIPLDELAGILETERRAGRRIVFTNGCFDVLHRGHTTSLRQAKALGGVLVVAINDDDSVRRLKGPTRPTNTAADRAAVLASLECVDYVTVFDGDTPIDLIERLRPDVYAKGGDYSPDMLQETPVVTAYGGEVRILDYVASHSTSELIERIRSRGSGAGR